MYLSTSVWLIRLSKVKDAARTGLYSSLSNFLRSENTANVPLNPKRNLRIVSQTIYQQRIKSYASLLPSCSDATLDIESPKNARQQIQTITLKTGEE